MMERKGREVVVVITKLDILAGATKGASRKEEVMEKQIFKIQEVLKVAR